MFAANQTPDVLRLYGQYVPGTPPSLIQPLEPSWLARYPQNLFFPVLVETASATRVSWQHLVFKCHVAVCQHHRQKKSDCPCRMLRALGNRRRTSCETPQSHVDGDNILDQYFLADLRRTSSYAFMNMAGCDIFKGPYEYTGDSDEGVKGLQFLYELMSVHRAMPAPGAPGGPWDLPVGHAASRIDGSWYVTTMLRHQPPFEWGIATMPSFEGERGTSIWPETPWTIPTGVPNPELSWRVLEYIASVEGQQHVTLLGLAMPPLRLDVARTTFAKTYPMIMTSNIVDLALAPRTQTIPVSPASARSLLEGAINSVMNGREPAQQALARIRPQVEVIIAEFIEKMVVR